MKKGLSTLFFLLSVFGPGVLRAQDTGEISQNVNVEKEFTPEIKRASKIYVVPEQEPKPVIDFSGLTYNIAYKSEPYVAEINPLSVPMYERSAYRRLYGGYADLMVGYPLQSDLNVYYATRTMRDFIFAAGFNHHGFYGNLANDAGMRESGLDMRNGLSLLMQYRVKRLEIKVDGMVQHRLFNRYGYVAPGGRELADADRKAIDGTIGQYLLRGHADVSIGTPENLDRKFNGRFRGFFSFISDKYGYNEQITQAGLEFSSGRLNDRHRVALDLEYIILLAGNSSRQMPPVTLPGQDPLAYLPLLNQKLKPYSTLFVYPRYMFGHGVWNITVGAKMTFGVGNKWYDQKTASVNPVLKVEASLLEGGLIPYFDLDGKYEYNTFYNLSAQNPFIAGGLTAPNTNTNRARVGIKGAVDRHFRYDAFAGYEIVKDKVLFVNDQYGNVFHAALSDFNNFVAGVYAEVHFGGLFYADARWRYTRYDNRSASDSRLFIGLPEHEAAFRLRVEREQRFGAYIRVNVQSERQGAMRVEAYAPLEYNSIPVKADLSVGGSYQITPNLGVNLQLNNLLNEKLYQYNFYRGIGFNALIGASFRF